MRAEMPCDRARLRKFLTQRSKREFDVEIWIAVKPASCGRANGRIGVGVVWMISGRAAGLIELLTARPDATAEPVKKPENKPMVIINLRT